MSSGIVYQTIFEYKSLEDFLYIPTPNTDQLNTQFHTFEEFRAIVNRVVAQQSTDWLVANAQFSPNDVENQRKLTFLSQAVHACRVLDQELPCENSTHECHFKVLLITAT